MVRKKCTAAAAVSWLGSFFVFFWILCKDYGTEAVERIVLSADATTACYFTKEDGVYRLCKGVRHLDAHRKKKRSIAITV